MFRVEERILILAPTGRDAVMTASFLSEEGIHSDIAPDLAALGRLVSEGCAGILIAEEALNSELLPPLLTLLAGQPSWSELPISIITSSAATARSDLRRLMVFGPSANVTLLERPFGRLTLLNTAQAALRSRRRQYQVRDLLEERASVLASINDAFVTLDREWRYVYVNDKAAELAGFPREQMIGCVIWELFPNLVDTDTYRDLLRAATGKEILRSEHFHAPLQRWLDVRIYPASRGVSVLTTDITERKHAEETLRQSEARHRLLSEASEVLVSTLEPGPMLARFAELAVPPLGDFCFFDVLDDDGSIRRAAAAHADPRKKGMFRDVVDFVPPRQHAYHPVAQAFATGRPVFQPKVAADWLKQIASGERHWQFLQRLNIQSLLTVPLLIGVRVIGAMTFCYADSGRQYSSADVETAQELGRRAAAALHQSSLYRQSVEQLALLKQSEEALRTAKEELSAVNQKLEKHVEERTAQLTDINEQLEAFVYSIAHDLRAPLRAMQAYATLLLEEYSPRLDKTAQHYAERIVRSSESMDRLVIDLLVYGRVARSELVLQPVSLREAWQAAVAQCEEEIAVQQAQLEELSTWPQVRAHEATLIQVLANLLNNALKFVAPGTRPRIKFRTDINPPTVRVTIEDNGIGIASQHHERIFRVFERLHGPAYTGTGIGLSIVRKGVERMGGSVGLDSVPDQGSSFWIELALVP